ncbi:hypothetical protein J4217_02385 [Candidatus Pacearchaeota archaeon]|nr:hypothetical protein [Candidatus Pacearchaeota archaeon]
MPVRKKSINQTKKNAVKPAHSLGYGKNKELYWILSVMAILLIVLLFASSIFKSFNTFKYHGLVFTKERFGQIPVFHHYYYFTEPLSNQQYRYNLYLRIDPRQNNVSIDNDLAFPYGQTVYFTINGSGLTSCSMASRDIGQLSAFLANNLIPIKAATPDKEEAKNNSLRYKDCDSSGDIVIKIQAGNETKITQDGNCHLISVANCETTEAIEKFEIKAVLDARARAKSGVKT